MASNPAARPTHAILVLPVDMDNYSLWRMPSRRGRLIAILASDTPERGEPVNGAQRRRAGVSVAGISYNSPLASRGRKYPKSAAFKNPECRRQHLRRRY